MTRDGAMPRKRAVPPLIHALPDLMLRHVRTRLRDAHYAAIRGRRGGGRLRGSAHVQARRLQMRQHTRR